MPFLFDPFLRSTLNLLTTAENRVEDNIPTEIGKLSKLTVLNLGKFRRWYRFKPRIVNVNLGLTSFNTFSRREKLLERELTVGNRKLIESGDSICW